MTKKVIAITTDKLKNIFSLAGIEHYIVENASSAENKIKEEIEKETIGLIIIEETIFNQIDLRLQYFLERRWNGVICKLPSTTPVSAEESYIIRLINRAVGYQIRIV